MVYRWGVVDEVVAVAVDDLATILYLCRVCVKIETTIHGHWKTRKRRRRVVGWLTCWLGEQRPRSNRYTYRPEACRRATTLPLPRLWSCENYPCRHMFYPRLSYFIDYYTISAAIALAQGTLDRPNVKDDRLTRVLM